MPCTLVSDAACLAPKTLTSAFVPLGDLFVQGTNDGFTFTWNTVNSYPDQSVYLIYRSMEAAGVEVREIATRDTGTITVTGLPPDDFYKYWIRVETDTGYNDWVYGFAHTSAGWDQDDVIIQHVNDYVFHSTDLVIE